MISWWWLIPCFIAGCALGIFVENLRHDEMKRRKMLAEMAEEDQNSGLL